MKLKLYRTKHNLTISQLSDLSSIPPKDIEDIEKGGRCDLDTARKLAEALNVNPYDLITEHSYDGPYAGLEFTDVLEAIVPLIDRNDLEQFILDINTYKHGIHIKSMDKSYQIYEDFCTKKIKGCSTVHWEKTEEQW